MLAALAVGSAMLSPSGNAMDLRLAENSTASPEKPRIRVNPGWGNAARVCSDPRIGNDSSIFSFRGGKSDFTTGFYRIGMIPNREGVYLNAVADGSHPEGTVLISGTEKDAATKWLVTVVGASLFQISTCLNQQPRCLVQIVEGEYDGVARLGDCDFQAYGTQTWWTVGIIVGPGKGGYQLGSDGIGRMNCLGIVRDGTYKGMPKLADCAYIPEETWRMEPITVAIPRETPDQAPVADDPSTMEEQPAPVTKKVRKTL